MYVEVYSGFLEYFTATIINANDKRLELIQYTVFDSVYVCVHANVYIDIHVSKNKLIILVDYFIGWCIKSSLETYYHKWISYQIDLIILFCYSVSNRITK